MASDSNTDDSDPTTHPLAQLAERFAHDLNNLLVVILGNVHLLKRRCGHDDIAAAALEDIRQAGERASEVTRRLHRFGQRQVPAAARADLDRVGAYLAPKPRGYVEPARRPARDTTVLLTEDDAGVRRAVKSIMRAAGYRVLTADGPEAACHISARHAGGIDLLLTDVMMPGMDGIALADMITRTRPATRVLLMSGGLVGLDDTAARTVPGAGFIQKPFTPRELLAAVEFALYRERMR